MAWFLSFGGVKRYGVVFKIRMTLTNDEYWRVREHENELAVNEDKKASSRTDGK
jgi:hypothetical protein